MESEQSLLITPNFKVYKDLYHTPKSDITPIKVMVAAITVMLFFVIPAELITFFRQNPSELDRAVATITNRKYVPDPTNVQPSTQGKVAGTSTSNATVKESSNIFSGVENALSKVDLSDEGTVQTLLGLLMVVFSSTVLFYLIFTEKRKNPNESYEAQYSSSWL